MPYLEKLLFFSYSWKDFQPNRLQDSHMPPDEMTGSKIQLVWSGMPNTAHNRGVLRGFKSSSFAGNSIEWKIK